MWLIGCGATPISDIVRDPGKFQSKETTIHGTVSDAFGAFGNGIYQVDDGTGRIWVLTQNYGIPGNGEKVSVTGQVQQGVDFGGRNYGLILRQTKARD
jgi:hypothetical protein